MLNKRAQTSLIMLFLFAVALIFFAISLNWSKIAQTKTQTLIAANTGATASASILASDAQSKWMQNLGGRTDKGYPSKCSSNGFLVSLFTFIIAIVAVIVTWGAAWYLVALAVASLVMAVANVALQLLVIQPGLTSLWNKLQAQLQPDSYYMEQGIGSAAQIVVLDSGTVPDLFDMNTDGEFYGGRHNPEVSRYGFFYTERLKMLQPPTMKEVGAFVSQLNAFTNGDASKGVDCSLAINALAVCCQPQANRPAYGCNWQLSDNPCTDPSDARCNTCCIPPYQLVDNPFKGNRVMCLRYNLSSTACWQDKLYKLVRSTSCQVPTNNRNPVFNLEYVEAQPVADPVPIACLRNNPYDANTFPYIYQQYYQNYPNLEKSFLEVIGQDAVIGGKAANNRITYGQPQESAVGNGMYDFGKPPIIRGSIFPLMWNMKDKLATTVAANTLVDLSNAPLSRTVDYVAPMAIKTFNDTECPKLDTKDDVFINDMSKWWKPKTDGMCQTQTDPLTHKPVWPYEDSCNSIRSNGDETNPQMICDQWHDDVVDLIAKQGQDLVSFSEQLKKSTTSDLEKSFVSWYPSAAEWIAPKCADEAFCSNAVNANDIQCDRNVCAEDNEGRMREWRRIVGGKDGKHGLVNVFDSWLKQEFIPTNGGAQALCLPSTLSADMSHEEASMYEQQLNGDFKNNAVNAMRCLNYYKSADQKFKECLDQCSRATCTNLPRSLVNGFNSNDTTINLPPASQDGPIDAIYTELAGLAPDSARAIELKNQLTSIYQGTACQADSSFLSNIQQSQQLAIKNKPLIEKRANIISDITMKAVEVRDQFSKAYQALDSFLGPQGLCEGFSTDSQNTCRKSPAYGLMRLRRDYQSQGGDTNNFLIYAWKGPKSAKLNNGAEGNDRRQYWHIARVEVKIPQRCPGNVCGASRMPWIRTKSSFFKRCYLLQDFDARALVRVTRWDEDHDKGNIVSFMNKVKLWQFTYSDPSKESVSDSDVMKMAEVCGGGFEYDKAPVGMTRDSWETIKALNIADEQKDKFKNAFMVNLLRGQAANNTNVPADCVTGSTESSCLTREKNCLALVDKLLSKGVSSQACARYYYRPDQQRMAVKFTTCGDGSFKNGETDYIKSGT